MELFHPTYNWLTAWRIIPVSKWLVTPIYKPFKPFITRPTLLRGLTITMVINHLQVLGWSSKWGPHFLGVSFPKSAPKKKTPDLCHLRQFHGSHLGFADCAPRNLVRSRTHKKNMFDVIFCWGITQMLHGMEILIYPHFPLFMWPHFHLIWSKLGYDSRIDDL